MCSHTRIGKIERKESSNTQIAQSIVLWNFGNVGVTSKYSTFSSCGRGH